MDIDDILREVDPERHRIPRQTRDLQALTRRWVAERSAPELLDWPLDGLLERVSAQIKTQIEKVEKMTGDMDPTTNFALIVLQTELERYKFLVRAYLRARLAKLDRHALHYLSSRELRARLAPAELAYAARHQALLHSHFLAAFLAALPDKLQHLNDANAAANMSMVDRPDLDAPVFIRLLLHRRVTGRGTDEDVSILADTGDVLILRWSSAKPLVLANHAELV